MGKPFPKFADILGTPCVFLFVQATFSSTSSARIASAISDFCDIRSRLWLLKSTSLHSFKEIRYTEYDHHSSEVMPLENGSGAAFLNFYCCWLDQEKTAASNLWRVWTTLSSYTKYSLPSLQIPFYTILTVIQEHLLMIYRFRNCAIVQNHICELDTFPLIICSMAPFLGVQTSLEFKFCLVIWWIFLIRIF